MVLQPSPYQKRATDVALLLCLRVSYSGGCLTGFRFLGCGSSTSEPGTASGPPCGQECSGEEVTQTGCNPNAVDVIPAQSVQAGGVHGTLALRRADPTVCDHIYWTRFIPTPDNTTSFEVIVRVNGTAFKTQLSEPGNPTLTAWTVGAYAREGDTVQPCVTSGGQETCLPATSVV